MSIDEENPKAVEPRKGSETLSSSTQNPATCCKALLRRASIYGVALGYCISASLLSIINKWAVMRFPYPGALTALQYFTIKYHGGLHGHTLWRFFPAAILFYISIFTNSELLLHSNVDTFIVVRSAVPIFVAVGETLFLHQPWPSVKTWLSLATIFGGSVLYVLTDNQFSAMAMSIDFVYIKHVVMNIGLKTWGLVLYNNLEALVLLALELLVMGELEKPRLRPWTRVMPRRRLERWAVRSLELLGLLLVMGLGLSWSPTQA
ncbi:hypothetical protein AAG906_004083 [Vitis piasezkii]